MSMAEDRGRKISNTVSKHGKIAGVAVLVQKGTALK
jgi:hypothetical protein